MVVQMGPRGERLLVLNIGDAREIDLSDVAGERAWARWTTALSTDDARFGGEGRTVAAIDGKLAVPARVALWMTAEE